jgi:uncharacterized protein (TIGR00297 family)
MIMSDFFTWQAVGIGCIASLGIAGFAYLRKSLSRSGACAAVVIGTLMYTFGSVAWFGTLIVFFLSSTVVSKLKHHRKQLAEHSYAKGHQRDAGQVLANGGLATCLCIAHVIWPNPVWWWAFLGAMATVNADTWATEIGGMSRSLPRSILTGKVVSAGTSGGVSLLGIGASIAGALCIGGAAWLFLQVGNHPLVEYDDVVYPFITLMVCCGIAGLMGSLADSWMGATWQVMYRCEQCHIEIEKPMHGAHSASLIRGYRFVNNDTVNMVSSVGGSIVAILLFAFQ